MFVISSVYHKTRAPIREATGEGDELFQAKMKKSKQNTQTILTQSITTNNKQTTTRQQINSKQQQKKKNAKFPAKQKRNRNTILIPKNPSANFNMQTLKTKSQSTTN